MSYYRASTQNPNGWRPGTVHLGTLDRAPDWKQVAGAVDHSNQMHKRWNAVQGQARMKRLMLVDAAARGDRGRLQGLSGLDLTMPMVQGAQYIFHFVYQGLGLDQDPVIMSEIIAQDTNFATVVGAAESGGMQFSFVYAGQGSTIGNAGLEMQNVINSSGKTLLGKNLLFSSAEGGPANVVSETGAGSGVSVQSLPGTPPAGITATPAGSTSSFSIGNFLAGAGIGTGAGLGLAALALFLVLRD